MLGNGNFPARSATHSHSSAAASFIIKIHIVFMEVAFKSFGLPRMLRLA
jgi:hypothetical protein